MSFSMVPIEVKEQIFAHLPLRTRMSLRQCSRIDQYAVTSSTTVVELMIIIREFVFLKSVDEWQRITQSPEGHSPEVCESKFNEKLNNFLKIVGSRLRVKKLVLRNTSESTFNFISQLNFDRIGCIDLSPTAPEDLSRFFGVIGDREFNIQLERNTGDFLNMEKMYEARSLKFPFEHTFNNDDMEKFKNLRRFESEYPGHLTLRTLRTFIRRWIEKREVEYHYFYLDTKSTFDPVVHALYLDDLFEGLEVQKYWYSQNDGILHIEKTNSEVGRLRYEEDCYENVRMCFVANNQLKSDSDLEIYEHVKP